MNNNNQEIITRLASIKEVMEDSDREEGGEWIGNISDKMFSELWAKGLIEWTAFSREYFELSELGEMLLLGAKALAIEEALTVQDDDEVKDHGMIGTKVVMEDGLGSGPDITGVITKVTWVDFEGVKVLMYHLQTGGGRARKCLASRLLWTA